MFELIADPLADEFARGAGIQALGILHHAGRLERNAPFGATLHLYAPEPNQKTLDRHYKSYTTVIEELSQWVCFSDRGIQAEIRNQVATRSAKQGREDELETLNNTDPGSDRLPESLPAPETHVRGWPKVGRNDPCPCGSGRKYKKCCLA